ncbi:MAG TPA: hypothetical protein PLX69_13885 [Leptospiraceae bacterium]|jgi:hypothetical protein|nr:hypothetical protein [Leptospiraceae bacterium]HRG75647.1 hypothetical protein [Leptospiraceae bacterium]
MNPKKFLIYGIVVCVYLIVTGITQWSCSGMLSSAGKWGPKGHSSYHK